MLRARILSPVNSVNSYRHATEVKTFEGTPVDIYFQLYDDAQIYQYANSAPDYLRYIPASGSTLAVDFINLDDELEFSRSASNPFAADDRSIWKVSTMSTDPLIGTVNLKLRLTESGVVKTVWLEDALMVSSAPGAC